MPASAGMTNFDTVSFGRGQGEGIIGKKGRADPDSAFSFLCLLPQAFNLDLFSPPVQLTT
jgi:hypothetical protein